MELLRTRTLPASARATDYQFLDALAFNWIIAGTDAHAKNYPVLLSGSQVRLTRRSKGDTGAGSPPG